MVDPVTLSTTTIAMTTAVGAFYQMLPPISQVRRESEANPEFAADVRVGEVAASVIALGIGAIAGSLSQSATPVVVSIMLSASLVFLYETTLRSNRPMEKTA